MRFFIYITFFIISSNGYTQSQSDYFYVKKANCELRLSPLGKNEVQFKGHIKKLLSKKGYTVKDFIENKRVLPGEDYIEFKISKSDDFWKKCISLFKYKTSEFNKPSIKDKIKYMHQTTRSLPRITPSGNERCTRSIKDLLVHLPQCIKN